MPHKIGVVVVHGIGKQKSGDTVRNFICGLREGFKLPDPVGMTLNDLCLKKARTSQGVEEEPDFQPLELKLKNDRYIRFYEAHWAPKLDGPQTRGSFKFSFLSMVVWFPVFNKRKGWYEPDTYGKGLRWLWTIVLFPSLPVLWLSLKGVDWFFSKIVYKWKRTDTTFAMTLDETAGDVVNYIKSRAGTHAEDEESKLKDVARSICDRFYVTMKKATEECDKVWVVAHSLGTVIAYDCLTGAVPPSNGTGHDEPFRKLTRLYTVGSPLEKVLFFWPRLVGTKENLAKLHEDFVWYNVRHKSDLVAGELKHFDHRREVIDVKCKGKAGFVTSHMRYYAHPKVHERLGRELLGPDIDTAGAKRLFGPLFVLFENTVALFLFVVSLIVGLATLAGFLAFLALAFGLALQEVDWSDTSTKIALVGVFLILVLMNFLWFLRDAKKTHESYLGQEDA